MLTIYIDGMEFEVDDSRKKDLENILKCFITTMNNKEGNKEYMSFRIEYKKFDGYFEE